MAKKQVFGDAAAAVKLSQRKMAKVIISKKNDKGSFSFTEHIINQDNVKDFLSKQK